VTGWGTPIANMLAYDLSQIVVSTDKSTYTQDDFLQYTGTGLTPGGSVGTCLSTDNDGALVCTSTTSDSNGDIAGSMQIGTNIPPGPQKFVVVDISTDRYSNSVQLTILKLTITTILFHTTPATFTGPTNPGSISACSGTFTDGQSAPCGATFSATANLPTPSSGWQFDHWTWSGGVTCTTNGNTASCSSSSSGGSLTAVYAAQVSFQTNPSSSALISWGSCGAPGEGNGQSIFSTSYGSVTACYVPSGYTLSSWSCSGGLACSGLNDPTLVTFNGPGTITMNLKTGSLSNPVSTSLITSASPANPVHGTSFTVSGTLTANGGGVGGETIVLVFGWTSNTVTVTTKADGSYTYTAMAPATAGSYKVQVFFLGDYGGTPQYLPSTATASITAT